MVTQSSIKVKPEHASRLLASLVRIGTLFAIAGYLAFQNGNLVNPLLAKG